VPITLTVDAAAYERRQAPIDGDTYLVDNWLAEEGGHVYAWPPPGPTGVPMRSPQGTNTLGNSAAAPTVSAQFAYQALQQTLLYTITLGGIDGAKVTSATLGYGRETDESLRVADLFPQPQAGNTRTGGIVLDDQTERQLAAGLLHLRIAGTTLPGGQVRGQLLFSRPVLHLPVYAAPRPTAQMHAEPQSLNFMTETVGTIRLDGQSLQGSAPPTEVVSLASVFELKLRSPNTRPSWLDPNGPDRFDHADIRYIGITSDLAQAVQTADDSPQAGKDPLLYFGVATWAPWTTPSEVKINVWLDVDEDGQYDYRLANGSPIAAIFGMGPGGPLTSELYDGVSGQQLAQQPLNGIWPQRYDSSPFVSSVMVLPVRLADLELPLKGGRIRFMVQTSSLDMAGSGVRYVDQTPLMQYDVAQPALTFSPPGAAAPLYADQPGTEIDVAFNAVGHSYSPASGVLILHHHNEGLAQAAAITVEARAPFRLYMPIVREQAAP
jgi:hypothetical protein